MSGDHGGRCDNPGCSGRLRFSPRVRKRGKFHATNSAVSDAAGPVGVSLLGRGVIVGRTTDAELLHFGVKRGGLESRADPRHRRAADPPVCRLPEPREWPGVRLQPGSRRGLRRCVPEPSRRAASTRSGSRPPRPPCPWVRMTARSITFCSSRMLPGQSYDLQPLERGRRDASTFFRSLLEKCTAEVARQFGDVFAALAQRRNAHGKTLKR